MFDYQNFPKITGLTDYYRFLLQLKSCNPNFLPPKLGIFIFIFFVFTIFQKIITALQVGFLSFIYFYILFILFFSSVIVRVEKEYKKIELLKEEKGHFEGKILKKGRFVVLQVELQICNKI